MSDKLPFIQIPMRANNIEKFTAIPKTEPVLNELSASVSGTDEIA